MGSKSKQAAARLGDIDTGHPPSPPTPIITGSPNVLTNGRPAARKGDKLVPHHPGIRTITEGSASVLINGKKAARVSDGINCGGKIIIGSGNVLIGDKPEAPRNSKLEMEFDEFMDESFKPEFQNLTPHQQAEVAANIAVKYRKQEGGISTWHEHYLSNDPAPGELVDPLKQKGHQRAQNEKAKEAKEMLGSVSGDGSERKILPRERIKSLTPEDLKKIQDVSTFEPEGVSRDEALNFLTSDPVGLEILRQTKGSAAEGTSSEVILDRAIGYVQSGKEAPQLVEITESLVKITPAGSGVSPYSPFFTTKEELNLARELEVSLSDYFGLPASSDSDEYDIFEITPKEKTNVYKSVIAPTSELNGSFKANGGGVQLIVPDRGQFHDAKLIGSLKDNRV